MSEALLSPLWYRVDDLRPRLRPHVRVQRQRYRGETWYHLGSAMSAGVTGSTGRRIAWSGTSMGAVA